MSRAINQIKKARKVLKNNSMKYPDDHEIAKMTGLSLDRIKSASNCLRIVASMNQKMGDHGVSYMVKQKNFLSFPLLLLVHLFLSCCDLSSNFVSIIVIFVIEEETICANPSTCLGV